MKNAAKTNKTPPAPATFDSIASAPAPKTGRIPRIKKEPSTNGASSERADSAAPVTVITAKIDIGFGNRLFVRGEGPGLSWDEGVPLDCVANDRWVLSLPAAGRPVALKFLLNDRDWSIGDDFIIEPGASLAVTPLF